MNSRNVRGACWLFVISSFVLLSGGIIHAITPRTASIISHGPVITPDQSIPDPITKFGNALVAWFDPWDSSTITQSSGVVSAWANKAGPGNLAASGTQRPTYSATAIQGNAPGLIFNGSTNVMLASGVAPGAVSSFALFMMTECDGNAAQNHRLAGYTAAGDAGDFDTHSALFLYAENDSTIGGFAFGSAHKSNWSQVFAQGTSGQPPMNKQTVRIGSVWDGTNHTFYLDNKPGTPTANAGTLNSPGTLAIGNTADGANPWTGAVGEIIMLNRAPTADDREYLQAWFVHNYARILVTGGDSTVHGAVPGSPFAEDGYVRRHAANASKLTFVDNISIGGSSLDSDASVSSMVYRAGFGSENRVPANKYGKEYVYYAYICNNIGGLAGTGAGYADTWVTFMADRKAERYDDVVMASILDRTDAGQNETVRHAFNPIVTNPAWSGRVANGGPVDLVVDLASHPIMGVDNAPTVNPGDFQDGVHPNSSGFGLLEVDEFTPAMNALP